MPPRLRLQRMGMGMGMGMRMGMGMEMRIPMGMPQPPGWRATPALWRGRPWICGGRASGWSPSLPKSVCVGPGTSSAQGWR